jgi:putative pyoverdin transport system ATP-binding/permease protein
MKNSFWKLISFYVKSAWQLVIPAMIAGTLAGMTSAAILALISVKVANVGSATSGFIWSFAGLAIFDMLAVISAGMLSTKLAQRITYDLRMRLCRKVLAAPLRRLEEVGANRLLAVLTQDIPDIIAALLQLPQLCIHVAVVGGCLVYLGWLSLPMLAVLLVFLGFAVFSVKMIERRARVYMSKAREEYDTLVESMRALTDGTKELKLHRSRREMFFKDILEDSAFKLQQHNFKTGIWHAGLNGWTQIVYFVVIGLILFALTGWIDNSNARQVMIGYALTILYMRGHILGVLVALPTLARANIALGKVEQVGLSLAATDARQDAEAVVPDPFWESLELRGVTHTYYREKDDGDFVLGPLDLTIYPGELLFIVGGNGSGKTTLAKILTGLYIPEAGEIRLKDEPVTEENRDHYRQYFTAIFSDFYLFDRLLGLGEFDLDERAHEYLSLLHLNHKVHVKDGKLSTTELSFGQRKRLALLTAYLEDRPIYIFDEWASGQDPVFREIFYRQLLPELRGRGKTIIVISHDDHYYHVADRILKLDDGKISFDQPVFDTTHNLELLPHEAAVE